MTEAALPTLSPVRWQDATIIDRKILTPGITSFFFMPTTPLRWRAGQHVDVRLTAADGYRAIRSYSIASGPSDSGILELAIERLPDGEVSSFFHEVAAIGDTIEIKGPLGGHFVWAPADGGPIFLVGGGSGLVPLMAMIRHRAATASTTPFHLLLSARTAADIPYRDELQALAARGDGFSLTLAITREPAARPGDYSRRIDAAMIHDVLQSLPASPLLTFICGTNGFVNAAADGAIAAGVTAARIRTERYGGA